MTNIEKIETIIVTNRGYITRKDIDDNNISSWFFTGFIRKNHLVKIDKGFYAKKSWLVDEYLVFQYKYPKYIFSYQCALYLHHLTDRIPFQIEVTGSANYRPMGNKKTNVKKHVEKNDLVYSLGITKSKTDFGYIVNVYDMEKTICDLIKHRKDIDSEIFIKALKLYNNSKLKNTHNLFKYAKIMKIEDKVFDIMEIVSNGN